MGSSQEGEKKKEITEVKTFPVPFALGEIKENIVLNTNNQSKPTKEQLINQAFKFHSKGNILEAEKYYKYLMYKGLYDYRVCCNYGALLSNLGKLKEAKILFNKAIELNPDSAESYSNLGATLKDLGNLKEAEISTRQSIKLNPSNADAYYNLGNILKDLYKSNEAFDSYLKAISINPRLSNFYPTITRFIRDSDPADLDKSRLKNILFQLLEKNNIYHNDLLESFDFLYKGKLISNLENLNDSVSSSKLIINNKSIINAFKKIIFKDPELEIILIRLRKSICYQIYENKIKINQDKLEFIIALGEQCFLNEYVYFFTHEEKEVVDKIIARCVEGQLDEINISIISCYLPLYKILDQIPLIKSLNSHNQSFNELIKIQILEPLEELRLSKNIKTIGKIKDLVSLKVKSQYEENPYPRWRFASYLTNEKISYIQAVNNEISPNNISQVLVNRKLKVLIAGCGTGQQILQAQKYKNADIIAIDLSSSSLEYAQRKINEHQISNVKFINMDILDLFLLKEKFDIIECGGVLHHMNDPIIGLKALLEVLNKNGFLKLGLYSDLARKDIIKAINYISKEKIEPNDDNLRAFRQKVISGDLSHLSFLKAIGDFYSLSRFRDLCFHTKEHRFTVKELLETLKSNRLNFLGFQLSKPVKDLYTNYFPEDKKQTNLKNWAKFEEKYPNTFAGMYQFWVSKISI